MSQPHSDGYLSTPLDGQGDPVLVLHPWWGLNGTIRDFCDRLAAERFVVFAPDLYHGQVVDTIPEAEAAVAALSSNYQQAQAEVGEAAAFLRRRSDGRALAVVGFSMGVYYGLALASAMPDHVSKVVIFYGTGDADFSAARAAYLGHFAADDEFEPRPDVDGMEEAMRNAGRAVTFHHYPGTGHWFYESDRSDAYNEEAAELAWARTLAFLKES